MIASMNINNVSSYLERLKQGAKDIQGKAGDSGSSRFDQLLNDPIMQTGGVKGVENFLGIGSSKDDTDNMSLMEQTLTGSMQLGNMQALATLTKVLGESQNPMVSMFRNMVSGAQEPEASSAVRMPVTPSTAGVGGPSFVGNASFTSPLSSPAASAELAEAVRSMTGANPAQASKALENIAKAQQTAPATPVAGVSTTESAQQTNNLGLVTKSSTANVTTKVATQPTLAKPMVEKDYEPGALAAMFESGSRGGISAIGYDRVGGTSYGKFQLSSRAGTMDRFLSFLDREAPGFSKSLRAAGSSNTGARSGEMPKVWKQIARTYPERFEKLQDSFIRSTNFSPAFKAITKSMGLGGLSPALQEVLFSTAIQHGPTGATKIFAKAFGKLGGVKDSGLTAGKSEDLIKNVYEVRAMQFGKSSAPVRRAVHTRLASEMRIALDMLSKGGMV